MDDIERTKLLEECAAIINKEYKSGQGYNIFDLTGDIRKELLHSAVIASLLDPKGKHGQGDMFLGHFLDVIGYDQPFGKSEATVICEKSIGSISYAENGQIEGGRIDIFLEDKQGRHIIIENKIDAKDQEEQILRYHKSYVNALILYLTLDGHEPTEYSCGDYKDYRCISYKMHIIPWLESCMNDQRASCYIRETIKNYHNLLKNNILHIMDNSIVDVLTKNIDSVKAAFEISAALKEVKIKAQEHLWTSLYSKLPSLKMNPEYFSLNDMKNLDASQIKKHIEDFYSAEKPSNSQKYYGIRVKLGVLQTTSIYGGIFVDNNIYYCVFTDEGSKELWTQYFVKAERWNKSTQDKVIAWRYPCDITEWRTGYNLVTFSDDKVKDLACVSLDLINKIAEDFTAIVQEVKIGLGLN